MNPINFPHWWHTADASAKIQWLVDSHHARSYSHGASMLSKLRHLKRRVIAPEIPVPEHVQAFVAEQERRHLF